MSPAKYYLSLLLVGVTLSPAIAASPKWHEFKGLYVGMPAAEAKRLGVNKCAKSKIFEETCEPGPDDKKFNSIGGARIKTMGIVIDKGKVNLIHVETIGAYWDELIPAMKQRYGKPKKESRNSLLWDRGDAEFISVLVSKGTISVDFGYSEFDSDKKIRERAKKAPKDF